uniref:Nodulin-like domain-containing protein n=1 Tax=Coccidioides posadasii RMSCC 3488 TaxID=454284 RepID=A0A0J6IFI2_COCPO|nr:hypothetical protein CPAG_06878 [Coccidioides posadasii RMSCC 3488]
MIGTVALFLGYFPIHRAYASGAGSMSVPLLCFFSFLTGLGSCSAFSASIKTATDTADTAASNFPNHRGSATAFPLAAFGLSAFFFSTIAAFAFRDDTSLFLLVLAVGTSSLIFVSSFFVKLLPHSSSYSSISDYEPTNASQSSQLHRTRSTDNHHGIADVEAPRTSTSVDLPVSSPAPPRHETADETSSLITRSSTSENPLFDENLKSRVTGDSLHSDLRGFRILGTVEFWQLFSLLGVLTGIGLMTINNIGNDVKALWKYYDDSVSSGFLQKRQAIHVSTLSVLSFIGRLISGIGSDLLVKHLKMSRQWCVFAASLFFCAGQLAGAQVSNPHHLILVSGMTGFAYGMLFGVYPSLVAHTFGIGGISQNWGIMTLAAVVGGNTFNLIYGSIYDRNSVILPNGDRDCREGLACYRTAYWVTSYAGIAGALITLWGIWHEKRVMAKLVGKNNNHAHAS